MKYQNAVYFDPPWTSKFDLICAAEPTTVERYEVWNAYIFLIPHGSISPVGLRDADEQKNERIRKLDLAIEVRQHPATIGNQYRSRCM